ncbi:MAG TPA: hypothetical protein VK899_04570 [Gemmatimonadales bacterium]|nr:hypothetical protein [Gemmatimonadales bacterium]
MEAEGEEREGASLGIAGERGREGEEYSAASNSKPGEHQAISRHPEDSLEEGPSSARARPSADVAPATSHGGEAGRETDLNESASIDRAMDDAVQAQGERGRDVNAEGSWCQEREEAEEHQESRKRSRDFRRRKSASLERGMLVF